MELANHLLIKNQLLSITISLFICVMKLFLQCCKGNLVSMVLYMFLPLLFILKVDMDSEETEKLTLMMVIFLPLYTLYAGIRHHLSIVYLRLNDYWYNGANYYFLIEVFNPNHKNFLDPGLRNLVLIKPRL